METERASVSPPGRGLIERYRDRLPIGPDTEPVTLDEGDTPLLPLANLARAHGVAARLYAKFEGANPTGSFKDRGMTVAVTRAVEEGARALICASTGNTSASAAAYAARAGLRAFVLIPQGKIAAGKLAQARMHGAVVVQIEGNFDAGMRLVRRISEDVGLAVVNSINPYRLQGQKTAAFEVVEELGDAPAYHCLPVGNAGNITAHWIGYVEACPGTDNRSTAACAHCAGECRFPGPALAAHRPVMVGYQASGAAPFLRGGPVPGPETVATAIRIGNPQSWDGAWAAVRESGGWFDELDDEAILAMQRDLAVHEGIFCEPASAISVAGAIRDLRRGRIPARASVVCTVTGHGLKDPDTALGQGGAELVTVPAEAEAVERVIGGSL